MMLPYNATLTCFYLLCLCYDSSAGIPDTDSSRTGKAPAGHLGARCEELTELFTPGSLDLMDDFHNEAGAAAAATPGELLITPQHRGPAQSVRGSLGECTLN